MHKKNDDALKKQFKKIWNDKNTRSMVFLDPLSKILLKVSLIFNDVILPLHNLLLHLYNLFLPLIDFILTLEGCRLISIYSHDHRTHTIHHFFLAIEPRMNFFQVEIKWLKTLSYEAHHVGKLTLNGSLMPIFQSMPLFWSWVRIRDVTHLNMRHLKLIIISLYRNKGIMFWFLFWR